MQCWPTLLGTQISLPETNNVSRERQALFGMPAFDASSEIEVVPHDEDSKVQAFKEVQYWGAFRFYHLRWG